MTTEAIWAAFADRLRRFIARRVRDSADAEDVLQEVFAKIHAGLSTLDRNEKLESWLFQITRHAIIDHIRRRRTSAPVEREPAEPAPPSDLTPEVASWLEPMMSLIPKDDREVLKLADLQGVAQKDVAARLGLSPSGARSRVQRARARLRKELLACCHIELDRRGTPIDYTRKRKACTSCSCS